MVAMTHVIESLVAIRNQLDALIEILHREGWEPANQAVLKSPLRYEGKRRLQLALIELALDSLHEASEHLGEAVTGKRGKTGIIRRVTGLTDWSHFSDS